MAGIIAANKQDASAPTSLFGEIGFGIQGVAPQAEILAIRADRPGSCQDTGEDGGCSFAESDLAFAVDEAVRLGARIINLSLGGEPDLDPTLENAIRRALAAGVLVVASAGNEAQPAGPDPDNPDATLPATGTSPVEPANMAGTAGTLGRFVAVGSVDLEGVMSSFSNRAGDTNKDYYILAPGEGVRSVGPDADGDGVEDFYIVSGTSFAAPYVSGSLALMLDLFPNITPEDALSALLDSARDYVDDNPDPIRGEAAGAGTDRVSGVGILDLRAAFAPQGATSMSINGRAQPLSTSIAPASGAFGDWAASPASFGRLVFTDKFNRAYRFDAANMMPSGSARIADFDRRADLMTGEGRAFRQGPVSFSWHQAAFRDDPAISFDEAPPAQFTAEYRFSGGSVEFGRGFGARSLAPDVSLIEEAGARTGFSDGGWARLSHDVGPMSLEVFSSDDEDLAVAGFGLSRLEDSWGIRGQVSTIRDDRTALGGQVQSRFGLEDSSVLSAYALEGAWRPNRLVTLSAGLEAASVDLPGVDVAGIWTSRWSLGAMTRTPAGLLGLAIAQPRRAESGTLRFDGVTGLDSSFNFRTETIDAPLSPSGREINYEARWLFALPGAISAGFTAALSSEPNHVEGAGPASVYWFNLSKTW